jgi:multidrug resistance efflux pump
MPSTSRSAYVRIGLGIALLLGLIAVVTIFILKDPAKANDPAAAKPEEKQGEAIKVSVIHPTMSDALTLRVDRPISVAPYNQNNIEAQVCGLVDMIRVAPGSRVTKGEELVKIAVPDLKARLQAAQALLTQRKKEEDYAVKKLAQAQTAIDKFKKNWEVKQELVKLRTTEKGRYQRLWETQALDRDLYDQSIEAWHAAVAARAKAESEYKDSLANENVAKAEVQVKKDFIQVADAYVAKAKALYDFATIKANFPVGYVDERKVDPYSLVQNASNGGGRASPILTLDQIDAVTVVMRVPNNYARFINQNTEAIIELDNLPGLKIRAKVTRYVKSLENAQQDRTMRVEVDLWNGEPEAYKKAMLNPDFLAVLKEGKLKKEFLDRLRIRSTGEAYVPFVGQLDKETRDWLRKHILSAADVKSLESGKLPPDALEPLRDGNPDAKALIPQLPQLPEFEGENINKTSRELLPGMYGKMTLLLKPTRRLIPSKAIQLSAGRAFVYEVKDGKAHEVPVKVRMQDEHYAYVVSVDDRDEAVGQLPGNMDIIVTELDQMSEGQEVKTTVVDDWSQLKPKPKTSSATEALPEENSTPSNVNVVQPVPHGNFQLTVDRPVTIRPYYRNNIDAEVSGVVRDIYVANGSHVSKGDELVVIHAPDLEAKVKETRALEQQCKSEKSQAEERVKVAYQAITTAEANEQEKIALVALRAAQRDRYQKLYESRSVDEDVYIQSQYALSLAIAEQKMARAEIEDATAAWNSAKEEVPVREEMIQVAHADWELAQVMLGFATIRANFSGYIQDRKVDPGSLVQNASNGGGHATPILTLERTDIVTVVMRVPDNYAAFINQNTDVILELDSMPGLKILGKVTRFAKSLETEQHDKTMRVEVDLWNGTAEAYKKAMENPSFVKQLKQGNLPLLPTFAGKNVNKVSTQLFPGMYGKMTLVLKQFPSDKTLLIPSQTIVREPNLTYIYTVVDGKAHKVPIEVQLDDGNYAYVLRVDEKGKVLGSLSKDTVVIASNQEELSEGQVVKPTPLEASAQQPKGRH